MAHAALHGVAVERRVLALAFQRGRLDFPGGGKIVHAQVGMRPDRQMAHLHPEQLRGIDGDACQCVRQRHLVFLRPFQHQRQQQLHAGRARFGFRERQLFGILVHW